MKLTNRCRWITAVWAVCALLFVQGALAGYACPADVVNGASSLTSAPPLPCAESMAQMLDEAQPSLCHAHCQDQQHSAETHPLPVIATAGELGVVLTRPDPPDADRGAPVPPPQWRRQTAPSVAIRHCCWRF